MPVRRHTEQPFGGDRPSAPTAAVGGAAAEAEPDGAAVVRETPVEVVDEHLRRRRSRAMARGAPPSRSGRGGGRPAAAAPVTGTPPLVYRGTHGAALPQPLGRAGAGLLNVFLEQLRAGTASCTDTEHRPRRQYIAALRAQARRRSVRTRWSSTARSARAPRRRP